MGPSAGEHAGVRGERPGGRRSRLLEPDPPGGQSRQVGGRIAVIAVGAQVIGADRVEHDHQHVGAAGDGRRETRQRPALRRGHMAVIQADQRPHGDEEHRQAEADDAPESRREGIEPPGGPARHPAGQEEIGERVESRDVEQQGQRCPESERIEGEPGGLPRPESGGEGDQEAQDREDQQVRRGDHPDEMPIPPQHLEGEGVENPLVEEDQGEFQEAGDRPEPEGHRQKARRAGIRLRKLGAGKGFRGEAPEAVSSQARA